ncbi:hypothetical protein OG1X_1863 [Enterococcus faecalis OG1X]|nr:hypothetical protein OG1X_1863 [Enterococcus faecalis OG1X]
MVCPDKRNWKNCCWCFASVSAGCGVRSAKTRPFIQNWRSFGVSPKSPP